jgi:PAS domain S-box-containing protein
VQHGPAAALVDPLSHAGFVTIMARDDYRTGHRVVQRVITASDGRRYELESTQARFIYVLSVSHWFEPLEDVVEQVRGVHERLAEAGDLQNAPYIPVVLLPPLLDCAPSVDALGADVDAGLALGRRLGYEPVVDIVTAFRQLGLALRGETAGPGSFSDAAFDEDAFLSRLLDDQGSAGVRGPFAVLRALSAAVFGQADDLDRYADLAGQALPALAGLYWGAPGNVVWGLALAQRVRTAGADERPGLLRELDDVCDWLARRAEDSPGTFRHLATWLGAERSWAVGDVPAALAAFDSALGDVQHRQRPWQRALITERAGLLHLEHGLEHTGRILLHGAHDCFQAWGATGKVAQLERDHSFLRNLGQRPGVTQRSHGHATVAPGRSQGRTQGRHGTLAVSSRSIDLMAVLKASQALSSETNLEQLRARVVEVLSALTGATTVRLLLWNDDAQQWYLPSGGGGEAAMSLEDAAAGALLPVSAFRYAERTREPLLVEDAARDDRFRRDPYLAGADHCSLLVVPVITHGALRAMLLLENRLSGGMFTADRLDTVVLIAGQLAVSIDNALSERFRSLVQRSSDLTLVCDRDGVMSYVSAASTEVLGLDEAALTGRPLREVVHADDWAEFEQRFQAPGAGDAQALEFRVVGGAERADGAARWVQATFTDLLADPAVGGIVVHLRDVTERHRLETDLRHAQKMESVGQLAAGIAHEINTPIQFVGDNVQFLSDAFGDLSRVLQAYQEAATQPDPAPGLSAAGGLAQEIDTDYLLDEIPSAIEQTRDGVSRVSTIVRAMKAFGHPSGDSKSLSDLNEAIRSTLVVAGSEIKYVADVVTELGDLPPVWCNLGDINQVVLNLVVNAAHAVGEAMRKGRGRGTITVRTRCEGDEVVVEVADTGTGIPPDIADRVFEQFFTTKEVGTGTGQGLALAYALVHDRHGGTIGFTSDPGGGTTFTIRLPHHQP